jgi:hypothetical protein
MTARMQRQAATISTALVTERLYRVTPQTM